jgi:hypothetical protein
MGSDGSSRAGPGLRIVTAEKRLHSSFRDPSGYVFIRDGVVYRHIGHGYLPHYRQLVVSGLYDHLVKLRLLIPHEEVDPGLSGADAALVLKPERVRTISYPYEWSFGMLRDAALATLSIQRHALERGMVLKDASAYNIQFHRGVPTLIDTLSFEPYVEGKPWIAYRQFCQHFVAPLALMSLVDARFGRSLGLYLDGFPLDFASRLCPRTSWLKPWLLVHLHLHARAQQSRGLHAARPSPSVGSQGRPGSFSRQSLVGLIDSLESLVKGLRWNPPKTTWRDYYAETNYSDQASEAKRRIVRSYLDLLGPIERAWDLGANTAEFSRLIAERGVATVAWDIDVAAVEIAYRRIKEQGPEALLPLVQDLTNPSPGIGWALKERDSLVDRGPVDLVLALALVHHLAIGNNVPLTQVAQHFSQLGEYLVVEFVPKEDSQVQRMLKSREDIFEDYSRDGFEEAFGETCEILRRDAVPDSERTLYLMRRRG